MLTMKTYVAIGSAFVAGIALWAVTGTLRTEPPPPTVAVKVPDLSTVATFGETLFNAKCAVCHGNNAAGTPSGPPLVHKIYEPGHHSDISFQRAARYGVRAHHWPYGNMPPVVGINTDDVTKIVTYVRELQRANGI